MRQSPNKPIGSHKGSLMYKIIKQMSPYGYQGA